jgi:diphthamide synthase (EF-2-diphthine--ammonia ligase)
MDHECSGQPRVGVTSGQVQIEPATLDQIASGHIRVHYQSRQERVSVKCLTCLQQLWSKDKEGCLRLTFRKGKDKSGVYRGYLISTEVPKSKQTKQVVCLSCVDRLLGSVAESGNGVGITVESIRDGGADAAILQRYGAETF